MEYFLHTATVDQNEYNEDELPLDLSDAWWEELEFHYKHQNECWERVNWCMERNIYFTIKSYRVFAVDQNNDLIDYAYCTNKKDLDSALEYMYTLPCSPMDWVILFINIPNEKDALLYKLIWETNAG
jgi:hypothetical protein